jgi:hypothetical protein
MVLSTPIGLPIRESGALVPDDGDVYLKGYALAWDALIRDTDASRLQHLLRQIQATTMIVK